MITEPAERLPSSGWVRLDHGLEMRPLIEGAGTALVLYRIERGSAFPVHAHPHPEYGTVIMGRGELLLDGSSRPLREGDSYYIPSNARHGLSIPPQTNPLVLLHVVVNGGEEVPRDVFDQLIREARAVLAAGVAASRGSSTGAERTDEGPRVDPMD